MVKNPPANAGDTGSILGLGRSHMPWDNKAPVPQLLNPDLPGAPQDEAGLMRKYTENNISIL